MEGTLGNNQLRWFILFKKKTENKSPAKLSDLLKVKEVAAENGLLWPNLPHIQQDLVSGHSYSPASL